MATNVKYDWYQTDVDIVVTILKRGVDLERCTINCADGASLHIQVDGETLINIRLAGSVDKDQCRVTCTPSKIEVRMRKADSGRWQTLEQKTAAVDDDPIAKERKKTAVWDKLAVEVRKEEEEGELDGDAAVNRLFSKIYKDADDDVKKAMIKSYSESGGTCLSTNWEDIKKKKTEIKPPDCMEYKKYPM